MALGHHGDDNPQQDMCKMRRARQTPFTRNTSKIAMDSVSILSCGIGFILNVGLEPVVFAIVLSALFASLRRHVTESIAIFGKSGVASYLLYPINSTRDQNLDEC